MKRPPDMVIGPPTRPYLRRWYLWRRGSGARIYLHQFLRDDDDRALHDHPWWFVSLILKGSYTEVTPQGARRRRRFSMAFRRAEHRHRVVLPRDAESRPVPCWTLVLTGRKTREWGFWCPQGFIGWRAFTKPGALGEIGPGCSA